MRIAVSLYRRSKDQRKIRIEFPSKDGRNKLKKIPVVFGTRLEAIMAPVISKLKEDELNFVT